MLSKKMRLKIKIIHQKVRIIRENKTKIVGQVLICSLLWIWLISGAWENLTSKRVIDISVASADVVSSVSPQGNESTATEASKLSSSAIEVEYRGGEATQTPEAENIEQIIANEFKNDSKVALAVFKAESRLNKNAINYNCEGYANGICPKGLEYKAWSVDCGIAQINIHGTSCPSELFDPLTNIKKAKEMHEKRGFQPWYTFKDKVYLSYL